VIDFGGWRGLNMLRLIFLSLIEILKPIDSRPGSAHAPGDSRRTVIAAEVDGMNGHRHHGRRRVENRLRIGTACELSLADTNFFPRPAHEHGGDLPMTISEFVHKPAPAADSSLKVASSLTIGSLITRERLWLSNPFSSPSLSSDDFFFLGGFAGRHSLAVLYGAAGSKSLSRRWSPHTWLVGTPAPAPSGGSGPSDSQRCRSALTRRGKASTALYRD